MEVSEFETKCLFDLSKSLFGAFLGGLRYPWQAICLISKNIEILIKTLPEEFEEVQRGVFVHKSARIATSASLSSPCIIGAGTELRHGAFVRGGVLVGRDCVVGNSVELKNCVLFDGVQIPHLSYVGDSILGAYAHLGAGAIISNLKADGSPVTVKIGEERVETGLRKFGAALGDGVQVGAGAVLNPGTVIGRNTTVYPLTSVRGAYPADVILKGNGAVYQKYAT